ncbi:fatty acid synthase S-acetyltransferase [Annulohypoxylon maeteangense]|uniref:fatty acid synthase S-acetyltransferase n=1 Tax=Annulohypoxylon maeteangense TaxID=1927788 RepID=UPI00200760F2|nr:fatty acid synthase S-acetyltransferase [Annulohypoxylon maeteangense]KAI0889325.1 fatty acid synthase S-acetyltransferase [Annulohypoxylon maeteangense]
MLTPNTTTLDGGGIEEHPVPNGIKVNGKATTNGSPVNGNEDGKHSSNGIKTNGYSTNGESVNGWLKNGHQTNGHHVTDVPVNGNVSSGAMPIAICGMALRLPGGLTTPQELWEFILAKGDARSKVPQSRYNLSAFYSPTGKPGTVYTEHGYFLDDSVDLGALDTSFFTMPRTEVERADPQQRLLLEVARECFEDAGVTDWRGKTIGCYVGNFGEDWLEMFAKENQQWGMHRVVGTGDFVLSNRISYEMDLRGPSMTLRTGCSAALVGLNEACMAISRGDCEAALIGGVNLILGPSMTTALAEQGVISKDGSCKTFSAEANGYARGEAVTAIYVKPLSDAIRDGNPIRAVIRATSHNVDGKTPGMSQPSADAQEALMRRAYKVAGITDFSQTAMVECHGTGTATGDPIETNAVARVFGESGVYIGSSKPNLGHSEGASGLVAIMKMVLALENRTIPPNIRFTTPNPKIPFKEAKLTVPLEPTPWPASRLERVSINSFGVGGANAHVILDSAATFNASTITQNAPTIPQLLLYSANTSKSLTRAVENYKQWVEKHPEKLADLAYTLALRREHLQHRTFAIANNGVVENAAPPTKAAPKPNIVMVFTGQGAQWPLMGKELLQSNETFKTTIQILDKHLRAAVGDAPLYSIEEELLKPARKSRLSTAELSQPLCTAIQIALVDTLKAYGIAPNAVVGHSSGEIAGAYAAGALTAAEAIIAAHHRGAVTTKQKRAGSMAAIGMSWEETEKHLVPNVTIACDNSPKSVTISGDLKEVKAVVAAIKKSNRDVLAKLLQVDKAYHSYHMAEIGEDYISLIGQQVTGNEPTIPFFSSVIGKLLNGKRNLGSKYWRDNLESPVRFREAVTSLLKHEVGQNAVFLEVGPHSALAGPLRQIFTEVSSPAPYVATMARNQNCITSLLTAVGKLHSVNVPIDLKSVFPSGSCLPDLPRYPWNHEDSYWYEPRICRDWRLRKNPYHDLLGSRSPESTDIEPAWRNMFHLPNAPWVRDHKVGDDVVFPFAGYIAIAGEAVRQITEINEGFSIRHIVVSMALVLSEGKPTEMMTTFRPHRLTNSLNSSWWEFTVSSFNGHVWTKHCTGEVTALSASLRPAAAIDELPRKLNARKWYETMRKSGLDLGTAFQSLDAIETSTNSENRAIGRVVNSRQGDEANYHIHPTVIDATLQIMSAAAVNGYARKVKNWLPTSIDKLSIVRCASDMITNVSAKRTSNHSILGGGSCTAGDLTVLEASGIRMTLADGALSSDGADTHAAARYEWNSDIDFLDIKDLILQPFDRAPHMVLLDELSQLCLLSSQRALPKSGSHLGHIQKYVSWIASQNQTEGLVGLDDGTLKARIEELATRLSGTPAAFAATALRQTSSKIDVLVSGQTLPDILSDDELTGLYDFINQTDISTFIQSLGHSKPNLQILEVGSGTGSSVTNFLKNLTRPDGQVLCSNYTFTSMGFISGKDQQKPFPNMEYATLNISKDLEEQEFGDRQFDLIIASNAVHITKNIQESLKNIKRLLRPDGRLLLQELCPSSKWVNYIFGSSPNWWHGIADGRPNEPYFDVKRWESELLTAGFGRIDGTVLDSDGPHQLMATVIARPSKSTDVAKKRVTILCEDDEGGMGGIVDELEKNGYEIIKCNVHDSPPPGQDVISLLDIYGPYFEELDSARFESFRKFLRGLQDAGLLWITPLCQLGCEDPRYAQVLGLARTMRSEMLVDFATCEVDDFASANDKIVQVLAKFQRREDDDVLKPDFEYAIRGGEIQVGRLYPFALKDELLVSESGDKAVLDVGTPGRLNTLHWVQQPREEIRSDEVELDVHSAGLNFRDILVAMGIVELPKRQFGLEAAGIVTRVGADVENIKVGDRVCCLRKHAYSTSLTTPEMFCAKLPDRLSFDEAASMLMPYVTSIHSLMNIGRLEQGQSVLIHSACGGVGLAAIQISQMLGADIYATVSNDEKVQFLEEHYNIPRNKIFNSRNDSFVEGIMRETNGAGVDLVLNSLSGELLHATWTCVAEFGSMIEIGKRDLIGNGKLDMNAFLANRSYCCVDIDQLWKKPVLMTRLIQSTLELYEKGAITSIQPLKIFPATETADAFRYMQKGQHIGRIGISLRNSPEDRGINFETSKRPRSANFENSASYLLVGGLGGLGRAISAWMVDHGARELIYLSRSAGEGPSDGVFVNELKSMNCDVKLVKGDVTNLDDVAKAVSSATHPLKGIIQMSMVLRDQNFEAMTFDEWNVVVAPKVGGTWNLHNATVATGVDLDFFVLFSSLSGIIGQPGQANYASANTFLDAFAQYRKRLGLAASVVDIGAVEEIGFISSQQGLMNKMKSTGFKGVTEQELLDAMALAMAPTETRENQPSGTRFVDSNTFVLGLGSTIPLSSSANRSVWRKDRRMASYHNALGGGADAAASNEVLKTFLATVKADPSLLKAAESSKTLALEIGKKLFDLLLKPQEDLNTSMSLVDLGLDSLVALELRAWWKQVFSFDISVLEMLGMGSLDALGQHAAEGLLRVLAENDDQKGSE